MIRGDFREDIGIFAGLHVSKLGPTRGMIKWICHCRLTHTHTHTDTHTHNVTLLPLICHLTAFQQKTFLQNWTGHWELWDLQGLRLHHLQVDGRMCPHVNLCIFVACCHMWAQCVSRCSVMCGVPSFPITSVWASSEFWLGRIVVLLRVTAPAGCGAMSGAHHGTNSAAGLITEHVYKTFIRTYQTHSQVLPPRFNELNNNTDLSRAPVVSYRLLYASVFFYSPDPCNTHSHTHTHSHTLSDTT